jgi:undecaprenyl-diphosphatase
MIIFGLLLWVADQTGMTVRKIEHMHGLSALIVGLAQVLALIPGTSRAGITITAARMMGYERTEASKFAMLLGIPVILAAGGWDAYEIWKYDDIQLGIDAILAALIAFITAYFSVSLLMSWLRHSSFTPFVLYRLFAGATILYIISMD